MALKNDQDKVLQNAQCIPDDVTWQKLLGSKSITDCFNKKVLTFGDLLETTHSY